MKRSKYSYKVNKLLSLLSPQDQDAFSNFVQFSPPYRDIQAWFLQRGHFVSINGIYRWWTSTQPNLEEIKIVNALAAHLDVKDFHRLHGTALKLAVMATSILDAHFSGKLTSADPKFLVEKQRELASGTLELVRLSRDGSIG